MRRDPGVMGACDEEGPWGEDHIQCDYAKTGFFLFFFNCVGYVFHVFLLRAGHVICASGGR